MHLVIPFSLSILGVLLGWIYNCIAIRWDHRFSSLYPTSYRYQGRIIWRYPIGALLTGLLFGLAAHTYGLQLELLPALLLISILMIIVQTDLTNMIIPNQVVAVGATLALILRLGIDPLPLWNYLIAALAGSGTLLLIGLLGHWVLRKEAMGGGDMKLYLFIGLLLGIKLTLLSLFLASLIGCIVGILQLWVRAHATDKTIPFGPYIAAGAVAAYFWGNGWVAWYLELVHW